MEHLNLYNLSVSQHHKLTLEFQFLKVNILGFPNCPNNLTSLLELRNKQKKRRNTGVQCSRGVVIGQSLFFFSQSLMVHEGQNPNII